MFDEITKRLKKNFRILKKSAEIKTIWSVIPNNSMENSYCPTEENFTLGTDLEQDDWRGINICPLYFVLHTQKSFKKAIEMHKKQEHSQLLR